MRASDLIPILSYELGIPPETGRVIDRSLANAGLRYKHKGPNPPDMTREECLRFMIAAMASEVATRAAEAVKPWLTATADVSDFEGAVKRWVARGDEEPELDENGDQPGWLEMPHDPGLELPFVRELNGRRDVQLMQFLLLMLRDWEHVDSYAESVVFDISRRGFGGTITLGCWDPDHGKIKTPFFFRAEGETNIANWEVADLDVRAFFHKEAFDVIIRHTADPLAVEDA